MSIATSRVLSPSLSRSSVSATTPSTRLASLDIFRGATIAMMLLVNNPGVGTKYPPLEHADWNGWTPTDLVFPFFLFIMGVAIPFSMAKRSTTDSKGQQFLHIIARGLSLFLLGDFIYAQPFVHNPPNGSFALTAARWFAVIFLFAGYVLLLYPWKSKARSLLIPAIVAVVYVGTWLVMSWLNHRNNVYVGEKSNWSLGIFHPDTLRIPGILQRLAVCYVIAASFALIGSWHLLLLVAIGLLTLNGWLMLKVPYPNVVNHAKTVHGLLGEHDNFARYVDHRVLGLHAYPEYPDPEGIVSTLGAAATTIFGILVGLWLRSARPAAERCAGLLSVGVLVVFIGACLGEMLMPINKHIYTPSYAVFCSGLAMLGLGMVFYFADVLQYRAWGWPLKVYGMNAIAAFVFSAVAARLLRYFMVNEAGHDKPITVWQFLQDHAAVIGKKVMIGVQSSNTSLAFALAYVIFWFLILAIMYASRIFLKV